MYQETKTRSVVKTVLWRIVTTLITVGTVYYYTGELAASVEIAVMTSLIAMVAYYMNERIWNKTRWGREES